MEVSNKTVQKVCERHGSYSSKTITNALTGKFILQTKCPKCAQEVKESDAKRVKDDQARARRERMHAKLRNAGIPDRFVNKTFDDYIVSSDRQQKIKIMCMMYAERFDVALRDGVCLAMIGNSGAGKNHLAMAIANHVVRNKYTAHYVDAYMMLSDVKHAQQSREERETDAIKNLSIPDLLIIDEIGDQVGSDADRRLLNKIINQRYSDNKPIIILSNLNAVELKEFLGTRAVTRFSENSGKILLFDWPNYRQNIKSEIWDK